MTVKDENEDSFIVVHEEFCYDSRKELFCYDIFSLLNKTIGLNHLTISFLVCLSNYRTFHLSFNFNCSPIGLFVHYRPEFYWDSIWSRDSLLQKHQICMARKRKRIGFICKWIQIHLQNA